MPSPSQPHPPHPHGRSRAATARASLKRSAVVLVTASTLVGAAAATAAPALAQPLGPQTTTLFAESFAESFAGSSTGEPTWSVPSGWYGNTACLTAGWDRSQRPVPGCGDTGDEAGVLRLTTADYSQVGSVFYDAGLPSAKGLDVSFDSYQWDARSGAADGISFALAATDPTNPTAPTAPGAPGAGLGYAATASAPGLPHGYLGVGLDVAGNFGVNAFGYGNTCPGTEARGQSVTVRGPGNDFDGYCRIASDWSNGPLDRPWDWSRPTPVPVQVVLNPEDVTVVSRGGHDVPARSWLVAWTPDGGEQQTSTGALPSQEDLALAGIPTSWVDPQTHIPYQLSFGWAGTTGAWASNHAVGNVLATTLTGRLPLYELSVTDDASGTVDPGQSATVTVTPSLAASGGDETEPATVTTTLPEALVPGAVAADGYDCSVTGQVVSCTSTDTTLRAAGSSLPPVAIPVTAADGPAGAGTVTAKVSSTDGNPASARRDVTLRRAQAITFAPLASPARVGTSQTLDAIGGGSGEGVTVTVASTATPGACSVELGVVRFTGAGSCVLQAGQAGDGSWAPAPTVSQTVAVETVPTSVSVAPSRTTVVHGQPLSATVTVGDAVAGAVDLTVDGVVVRSGVAVGGSGTVSVPVTGAGGSDLAVGAHAVSAAFVPRDATTYARSTATPQTVSVDKARTTTSVTVERDALTARVAVSAPGRASVSGTVSFSVDGVVVGSAAVVAGWASLAHRTPADADRNVSATYSGDERLLGSSGSTARTNPTITARVSSPVARSKAGWYRGTVTVSFTCTAPGAPLTTGCPAPVTLSGNGAAQSVTRSVSTTDGGVATAAVSGISIDHSRPAVKVAGVQAGGLYFASTASARCVGSDALSGLASCKVTRTRSGDVETITARATDRAGNQRAASVTVHVVDVTIAGASWSKGVYTVKRGRTYTLLAASTKRPRYVDAAFAPRAPKGEDNWFRRTGRDRWAIGVTMDATMRPGLWNLGVRRGDTLTVLRVKVTR